MTSYESLHIFKLIEISIPCFFLILWNFFVLAVFDIFKMKEYQLFLVISVHVEKQWNCSLSRRCKLHVLHFPAIISLLIKDHV